MTKSSSHLRIIEETPAYWRAVFDNPPLSIMGARMFEGLQDLLARMDAGPSLRVVVFESSNPEFYLGHFDLSDIAGSLGLMKTAGPSGLPILMDTFVRLTKSPVVSLVGRGRALEIIIGSDDFDGETAERYGYVNRALPDAELDGFVDKFARRIATFDRRPIEAAKNLVNQVSLPSADRLLDGSNSFLTSVAWPEAQRRFQALFDLGLNKPGDTENRYGELLGTLLDK
jgi:enoyl-CoA hydratase/carnithine racemase